jgi:hypothetical protein
MEAEILKPLQFPSPRDFVGFFVSQLTDVGRTMRHTEVIAELLSQRHYAWHVLETYKHHPTATPGVIDRWDRKFRALDYAVVILSGARAPRLSIRCLDRCFWWIGVNT